MEHPLAMRLVKRVGDFDCIAQDLIYRQKAFLQAGGQGFPFQVLHHQEIDAVLLADIVQGANMRIVQAGDGACLALETLAGFSVRRQVGRQDLDGNSAIKPGIFGAIHLAHAACAQ